MNNLWGEGSRSKAPLRPLLLGSSIIFVLLLVAACSQPPASTKTNPFLEMLKSAPALPNGRNWVTINDYARVRELYKIPAPALDADEKAIATYVAAIFGEQSSSRHLADPAFASGFYPGSPIRVTNVAYGPQLADQDMRAGAPPQILEAVKGRFDSKATEDAITRCDGCSANARAKYMKETYKNVTVHSWGDGQKQSPAERLRPPVFDYLGRLQSFAVVQDIVVRTPETIGVKMTIDLLRDGVATVPIEEQRGDQTVKVGELKVARLADVEEFKLLAQAMSDLGSYSVMFTDVGQEAKDYEGKNLDRSLMLRPYVTLGVGLGQDDKGRYMTVALVHQNPELASENVSRLRTRIEQTSSLYTSVPWRDNVEATEIRTEGRVLLAKLRGDRIAFMWQDISLLVHE